eukprot:4055785-Alexandrium_andersonii.AAC.1
MGAGPPRPEAAWHWRRASRRRPAHYTLHHLRPLDALGRSHEGRGGDTPGPRGRARGRDLAQRQLALRECHGRAQHGRGAAHRGRAAGGLLLGLHEGWAASPVGQWLA